jgi:hypothetical protein
MLTESTLEPPTDTLDFGEWDIPTVLAIFEHGRRGNKTVRAASEAAERSGARLMVVTLVTQLGRTRCCGGPSPLMYNCVIRDAASEQLGEARDSLGPRADDAEFRVLAGKPEPPIRRCVAEGRIGLVFIPRHRLTLGGHWAARRLRSARNVEVRLVR